MTTAPILGVDPGITGGVAALFTDGTITAFDIPVVDGSVDVDALVRRVRELAPRLAIIEKAQAMPK
jgi:predicted RNase H-like nuclease (RuvC/YqgF family)